MLAKYIEASEAVGTIEDVCKVHKNDITGKGGEMRAHERRATRTQSRAYIIHII